jgi:hypothetical protein
LPKRALSTKKGGISILKYAKTECLLTLAPISLVFHSSGFWVQFLLTAIICRSSAESLAKVDVLLLDS